jgi:hypothetical protein
MRAFCFSALEHSFPWLTEKTHPFQRALKMQLFMFKVLKGNSALATQDSFITFQNFASKLISEQVPRLKMAKFWKAVNQSCLTSAQYHFIIQLNSEMFDIWY